MESPFVGAPPAGGGDDPTVADVPRPENCIGQVVLDWEFIHDLDLHLLKVVPRSDTSNRRGSRSGDSRVQEPGPEPNPSPVEGLPDFELSSLVNAAGNELELQDNQALETVVYYGK